MAPPFKEDILKQDIKRAFRPASKCKIFGWQGRKELYDRLSAEKQSEIYEELDQMHYWFHFEFDEVLEKYGAETVLAVVENTDVTGLLDPSGCNHLNWVEEELCTRLDMEIP